VHIALDKCGVEKKRPCFNCFALDSFHKLSSHRQAAIEMGGRNASQGDNLQVERFVNIVTEKKGQKYCTAE
jgi:hypothetical protein